MKRPFQPAKLLLYLLSLLAFLFVGMSVAGITGAGKGQGLAGGAIVLQYGLIFGVIGVVVAVIFASRASQKAVVTANKILALLLVAMLVFVAWRISVTS
ncbi:MAG: hypothetical protein IPG32_18970 [Saprospirales bacterium]|nr:hypothetical protein [Saprospirales bacterium]